MLHHKQGKKQDCCRSAVAHQDVRVGAATIWGRRGKLDTQAPDIPLLLLGHIHQGRRGQEKAEQKGACITKARQMRTPSLP